MRIIEEAANRLEVLRRSGAVMPWLIPDTPGGEVLAQREEHWPRLQVRHAPEARPPRTPPGVTLDLERLQALGYLVPAQSGTTLAREFRRIKRPLLESAQRDATAPDRLSLVMVTSAVAGEGKTFCAINLALSIAAEIDTSVLLVDADVVHPEVMQRLGVEADKGLLDVLTDARLGLADVIRQTNVPRLSILPAGTPSGLSTELLASRAMQQLLDELAMTAPRRVVIFDAPALLATTEAAVLASRVGQVLLVVQARRTPCRTVREAFACLQSQPHVTSLLNQGRPPARG